MTIFAVGIGFHILVYDLAYINVMSVRVKTDAEFKKDLS